MYITNTGLGLPDEVLVRLTDDENSGMVNTARLDDAIVAASGYVDAALSARFAVPLANPSEQVRTLTREIAAYNLYLRAGSVPDDVRQAYEAAAAMLRSAAEGSFHLGLAPDMDGPVFDLPEREFSREYMEGFYPVGVTQYMTEGGDGRYQHG